MIRIGLGRIQVGTGAICERKVVRRGELRR